MAITFQEKERKQRYWILVFIIIIFAVFLVFYSGIFKQKKASPPLTASKPPRIEINFEVLKNPFLKELLPFEEIKPFEEKVGRENPFEPY